MICNGEVIKLWSFFCLGDLRGFWTLETKMGNEQSKVCNYELTSLRNESEFVRILEDWINDGWKYIEWRTNTAKITCLKIELKRCLEEHFKLSLNCSRT
jgi:hypothetical protein